MKTSRTLAFNRIAFWLTLAAAIGCTRPSDAQVSDDPASHGPISAETVRSWDDPSSPKALIGLNETSLGEALGPPTSSASLVLDASSKLPEYQSSLYRVKPKTESLTVKEMTWNTEDRTIKVWLKHDGTQWASFDSLAWSDNVRF